MIPICMLRYVVIILTSVIFILLMKCVSMEANLTAEESNCKATDIDTHLKLASELIETSRRKLSEDIKELCRMAGFTSPPDCSECQHCISPVKSDNSTAATSDVEDRTSVKPGEPKAEAFVFKEAIFVTKRDDEKAVTFDIEDAISTTPSEPQEPLDCSDIHRNGSHADGVYEIWQRGGLSKGPIRVYCDMTTDGGGWTVIQRRGDFGKPEDYFYRNWNEYKTGFGDISKEFWIGNDNIFMLTNQRFCQLRVDLEDWDGDTAYVTYDHFRIDNERYKYTLFIGSVINGSAGDSLNYHRGVKFSTKDRDNDEWSGHCAIYRKGGWWYRSCHSSNLNGLHLPGTDRSKTGIIWYDWTNSSRPLKSSVMKVRPASFHQKDKM